MAHERGYRGSPDHFRQCQMISITAFKPLLNARAAERKVYCLLRIMLFAMMAAGGDASAAETVPSQRWN